MSEPSLQNAQRERRRALILPREHGAWGLLLVPLLSGAGVALRESHYVLPLFLLLITAMALFWMRTPVESLLATSAMRAQSGEERRLVAAVIAILAGIASIALGGLLWGGRNRGLWLLGAAAGLAFAAQALLKKLGRPTRMLSEIVGTVGLTAAAPAAYYVVTGTFNVVAWMLWFANLLFAGNQIHYVQLRIHSARIETTSAKLAHGWAFAAGQAVMIAMVGLTCARGLMPWAVLIAYVPALIRGWLYFFRKPRPLMVRRLGWSELAHAVAFCVLFVAAFWLERG